VGLDVGRAQRHILALDAPTVGIDFTAGWRLECAQDGRDRKDNAGQFLREGQHHWGKVVSLYAIAVSDEDSGTHQRVAKVERAQERKDLKARTEKKIRSCFGVEAPHPHPPASAVHGAASRHSLTFVNLYGLVIIGMMATSLSVSQRHLVFCDVLQTNCRELHHSRGRSGYWLAVHAEFRDSVRIWIIWIRTRALSTCQRRPTSFWVYIYMDSQRPSWIFKCWQWYPTNTTSFGHATPMRKILTDSVNRPMEAKKGVEIQTSGSFSRTGPMALRRGAMTTFSLSHWFGEISLTVGDDSQRLTTPDFQYISASMFVRTSSIDFALTSSNDPAIFFGASSATTDSGVRKAPPNTEEG